MPRELVHWSVLTEATNRLPADSFVRRSLEAFPAVSRIGAMAHDAAYYDRLGKSKFEAMAEYLHGTHGEDTFEPIRVLIGYLRGTAASAQRDVGCALLSGILSHAATDIYFHPLVYYFTGDYYCKDPQLRSIYRSQHRIFEVHLDSWCRVRKPVSGPTSIRALLTSCGEELPTVYSVLGEGLAGAPVTGGGKSSSANWQSSFKSMAFCQGAFNSNVFGAPARVLKTILPGMFQEIDSLCSFGRSELHPFFEGKLNYKNPVSGDDVVLSTDEIYELSVANTLLFLNELNACLSDPKSDRIFMTGLKGPSLNFGLTNTQPADAKYFSKEFPFA